jgi:hypothetical protein
MKKLSLVLGIAAATLLASALTPNSPTLTELPTLSDKDPACGATAINDKGQIIGWSGEPG